MTSPNHSHVTVILQALDQNKIVRSPVDDGPFFGLNFFLDGSLAASKAVLRLLTEKLSDLVQDPELEIVATITPPLRKVGCVDSCLYLVKIKGEFLAPDTWPVFVNGLKSLLPGPNRVAYNKAFQYMLGANLDKVEALELDKALIDTLKRRNQGKEV